MVNEVHMKHSDKPIRTLLDRMRHDGSGGGSGGGGATDRHRGRQQPSGARASPTARGVAGPVIRR